MYVTIEFKYDTIFLLCNKQFLIIIRNNYIFAICRCCVVFVLVGKIA